MSAFLSYAPGKLASAAPGGGGANYLTDADAAGVAANPDSSVLMVYNPGTVTLFVDMAQLQTLNINNGFPVAPGQTAYLAWLPGQTWFQAAASTALNFNFAVGRLV